MARVLPSKRVSIKQTNQSKYRVHSSEDDDNGGNDDDDDDDDDDDNA